MTKVYLAPFSDARKIIYELFCVGLFSFLLTGCGGYTEAPYKGDPLKSTVSADYCQFDSAAPKETFRIAKKGKVGEYDFAEGGGCLLAPLDKVWESSRQNKSMEWKKSDLVAVKPLTDPRPFVPYVFEAQYEVKKLFYRAEWFINYYHALVQGTPAAPKEININFKMVRGTDIAHWEGSIRLVALSASVTSLSMRTEIKAPLTGANDMADGVNNYFHRIRDLSR